LDDENKAMFQIKNLKIKIKNFRIVVFCKKFQ